MKYRWVPFCTLLNSMVSFSIMRCHTISYCAHWYCWCTVPLTLRCVCGILEFWCCFCFCALMTAQDLCVVAGFCPACTVRSRCMWIVTQILSFSLYTPPKYLYSQGFISIWTTDNSLDLLKDTLTHWLKRIEQETFRSLKVAALPFKPQLHIMKKVKGLDLF